MNLAVVARFYIVQDGAEQQNRARLIQGIIAVAAFWRLNATRATALTLAGFDSVPRCSHPVSEAFESSLGKSGSTRLSIVDKDRWVPSVHM